MDKATLYNSTKLVAFDLDGTLVDAFEDITAAVNCMLRHFGQQPITIQELKKHVGRGSFFLTASVLGVSEDDPVMKEAYPVLYEHYYEHPADYAKVYPDTIDFLDKLKHHGILLAVTSNKPHPMTVTTLEKTGLIPYFDWVRGCCETFPRKPAPDILQHLMSEVVADKNECIVIGDTEFDIQFARNAGVRVIAVAHGQSAYDELLTHAPDMLIRNFKELL